MSIAIVCMIKPPDIPSQGNLTSRDIVTSRDNMKSHGNTSSDIYTALRETSQHLGYESLANGDVCESNIHRNDRGDIIVSVRLDIE